MFRFDVQMTHWWQRTLAFAGVTGWWSVAVVVSAAPAESSTGVKPQIDFNRQVRPILSENCFSCHGPDEGARKSKLRLDLKDAAFKGGKSGLISIVPGKPEESELIKRIITSDEDDVMPPPKSKKKLTPAQIDLLKQW